MSRTWTKPCLMILTRGEIEESVLGNCKSEVVGMGLPEDIYFHCYSNVPFDCGIVCSAVAAS